MLGILGISAFGVGQPLPTLATTPVTGQKVVIIVGPASSSTSDYITQAKLLADQARAEGMRVTEIFTPHATWDTVKQEAQDANLLVYFGHGNGFPSRYGPTLHEDSQDGLGLNAVDGGSYSSDVKYWGGDYVRSGLHLAANAVVLLYRLCYASGNGEDGIDAPELPTRSQDVRVAIQRVDNFAAGFLAAGARDVFAWGWPQKINLPQQLAETNHTMDRIFEERANDGGYPTAFVGTNDYTVASHRTPGAMLHLDPHPVYGHLRALSGDLQMTAGEWRGEGAPPDTTPPDLSGVSTGVGSAGLTGTDGDPAFSPNGDGIDDTLAVNYTMSEPGTVDTVITDSASKSVLDVNATAAAGPGTVSWDGTTVDGRHVPDGRYTLTLTPTDTAGNVGRHRAVSVWVLTALSSPEASVSAIEPGGTDPLTKRVRFMATLNVSAAIRWTVIDSTGRVVRHGTRDPAAQPGDVLWGWNGLDDLGNAVPTGTYSGVVSATTAAGTVSYASPVFVGPFKVRLSDTTLRGGQKVKITVFNTELLAARPQLTIHQKGVAPYTMKLHWINDHRYTLIVTLKTSTVRGLARWVIKARDISGATQRLTFRQRIR